MGVRLWSFLAAILPFAIIIVVWHAVTVLGKIDPAFLPSPARVLKSSYQLATGDFIKQHLLPSVVRVTAAFALSVVIAFPLGILCGHFTAMGRYVLPLFAFTRYLPVPSLVPLCILWFGIDDGQKIAVITIGVIFQLIILLAYDSASVPEELIAAGRTLGLSRARVVWRIVLPAAFPAVWDHLRVAAGWAWSYLVLSELVAGSRGVGYFVVQSQRYLQTDSVFAGILFIGILGALTDLLFRLTAARMFQWT